MLNNIVIGSSVTLDTQTRTLTRTRDGESVTLPASACLCLRALVEAQGDVLSQDQLMDIGWRSAGVEVTDNSVRVMINKLRRALNTLQLQDNITLLAVTRSGYRLIVRDDIPAPEPQPSMAAPPIAAAVEHAAAPAPAEPHVSQAAYVAPAQVKPSRVRRYLLAGLSGIAAGLMVAFLMHLLFIATPTTMDFVRWTGPDVSAGTEVMVPKGKEHQQKMIDATLRIYQQHVLDKRPGETPAQVLYLTLADARTKNHLGLIACVQPLQDANNDCESYYFRIY
ncbi:transcriptional regulator [Pseudescherichia vulneris]